MMVIAEILIHDCQIPVEITDTWKDREGRVFCSVVALRGEPFTKYSMGGPMQVADTTVRKEFLRDIRLLTEE